MEVIPPKIIEVGKIATERTSPSVIEELSNWLLTWIFGMCGNRSCI